MRSSLWQLNFIGVKRSKPQVIGDSDNLGVQLKFRYRVVLIDIH